MFRWSKFVEQRLCEYTVIRWVFLLNALQVSQCSSASILALKQLAVSQ
jgi:hypothetical protein